MCHKLKSEDGASLTMSTTCRWRNQLSGLPRCVWRHHYHIDIDSDERDLVERSATSRAAHAVGRERCSLVCIGKRANLAEWYAVWNKYTDWTAVDARVVADVRDQLAQMNERLGPKTWSDVERLRASNSSTLIYGYES